MAISSKPDKKMTLNQVRIIQSYYYLLILSPSGTNVVLKNPYKFIATEHGPKKVFLDPDLMKACRGQNPLDDRLRIKGLNCCAVSLYWYYVLI